MLKTFICTIAIVVASSIFVGCNEEQSIVYVNEKGEVVKPPAPKPKYTVLWSERHLKCIRYEGHDYLMGTVDTMSHGSYGVTSLIHSESCACKTNAPAR